MIVVSNTSPMCYLILIGQIGILPLLYREIHIPRAVRLELGHQQAPESVRTFISHAPDWLKIHPKIKIPESLSPDLHDGEAEAIQLGLSLSANLIIIDEMTGRKHARQEGLNVTGLLGVLYDAAQHKLLDLPQTLKELNRTSFRISPSILKFLLEKYYQSYSSF